MKNKKSVTKEAALTRMADLCARSEQCRYDVARKLSVMGLTGCQVEEILTYLKDNRFVDDARYAGSFARDKCRFSGWGRYKIRVALMAKHIPAGIISDALESIDQQDYTSALRRVAESKARSLDLWGEERRENRMKLYRHILSRGFESDAAQKIIRDILRRDTR